MKRYSNLYPMIVDKENLQRAHKNARKGKRHYQEVQMVDSAEDVYIDKLYKLLSVKTFSTAEYEVFKITEPKERYISKLPYFPDRIVQHAIMQVCQPIWDKVFIYDSYAAVPGKGIHAGVERLRSFLKDRSATAYCLKMDVAKFYPNVDHDILMEILRNKIKCPDTLWILEDVVRSVEGGKGLPIGNYLSQYFSNLYLNGFDHWVKEVLGCKYYIRYCDDAVILHYDKRFLHEVWRRIEEYLADKLRLKLNRKTQLFPVEARGIDFLGYRTYHDFSLLRKNCKVNFANKIKAIETISPETRPQHIISSVMSYVGWLKHCNSYNLANKYIFNNKTLLNICAKASEQMKIKNPIQQYIEEVCYAKISYQAGYVLGPAQRR